jgi:hypothetical protein
MDALEEAVGVLRTAEQKLRGLIAQAADKAEYDHLSQLAEWAKQINALLGEPAKSASGAPPSHTGLVQAGNVNNHPAKGRNGLPSTRSLAKGGKKTRGKKKKKPEYPKFIREGETLVKVGWSKREKKPYEHKAPRRVLRAMVRTLVQAGKGGGRFTTDGFFPLKDTADNSDIPDYQAYLVLAWLRDAGQIVQHGRQGYSLPGGTDLTRESERLWDLLPTR